MIEYIKGEIVELTPTRMILECGGIGYELNISLNTYSAFGNKTTGKIYIYEVIREDAHLLFGFAEKIERELFLLLTSVSGHTLHRFHLIFQIYQDTLGRLQTNPFHGSQRGLILRTDHLNQFGWR